MPGISFEPRSGRGAGAEIGAERGTSLFLGVMALVFLVPLVGLVVDVGFLYAAKAKLQAAVDGAALAAARALTLGQTTTAQAASAQQNAVNWFYANFPNGNWGTSSTNMTTANVQVFDDPVNPSLRNVVITATTLVPTYFMKWFNVNSTLISSSGNASRRDVVAMLVLDRSGSMNNGASPSACQAMVTDAKAFTGQFAAGRDHIGLISFSDNAYVHSVPSTDFQTVLGYTNESGSGTGQIDTITCQGGTSTAEGLSLAYQLLYQMALPGALNLILLETDGLPNTLAVNFWDSANRVSGLNASSSCKDTNGKTPAQGGFASAAVLPAWTAGLQLNASPFLTSSGVLSNIPSGMVGAVASTDPGGGDKFYVTIDYWTSNGQAQSSSNNFNSTKYLTSATASGCAFTSTHNTSSPADLAWFPSSDVFANRLNPSYSYTFVTTDAQGHVKQNGWSNFHNAVLNATENSAYQARSNATDPAYVFAIGLGGNSVDGPPDPVLLQRMANDPNGDVFNTPALYPPCAQATNCVTWPGQPQGTFLFAPDSTQLGAAFLKISSQILRLSH